MFWAEFSASALFSWFRVVHDVWILWKLGGVDGDPVLRGTRIRARWGYVSSVEGGQLGMVGSCLICESGRVDLRHRPIAT